MTSNLLPSLLPLDETINLETDEILWNYKVFGHKSLVLEFKVLTVLMAISQHGFNLRLKNKLNRNALHTGRIHLLEVSYLVR